MAYSDFWPRGLFVRDDTNRTYRWKAADGVMHKLTSWVGDSIATWDGDTLVVETTRPRPDEPVRHRLVMGPQSRVVERFRFVLADELLYQFTARSRSTCPCGALRRGTNSDNSANRSRSASDRRTARNTGCLF
jgi:hypothetical protein